MARKTEAEWQRERGRLFLRELHGRRFSDPAGGATAVSVGEAVGLDPFEVSLAMTWLIGHRMVTEVGLSEHGITDAHTVAPIEVTEQGMRFLDTGEL